MSNDGTNNNKDELNEATLSLLPDAASTKIGARS